MSAWLRYVADSLGRTKQQTVQEPDAEDPPERAVTVAEPTALASPALLNTGHPLTPLCEHD